MGDKASRALAGMTAAMVAPHDVSGTLVDMLTGIRSALDVEACGILAADETGRFEVLSASSHDQDDLRLFESQTVDGPAASASRLNNHVAMSGLDDVREEWPLLAAAMEAADYGSVLSCPLRWNGETLGSATVFRRGTAAFTAGERQTLQAFADLAMLVVVHSDRVSVRTAAHRMGEALEGRVLIEQAKGVLAYHRRISMAQAYVELQDIARDAGVPLTVGAEYVIGLTAGP